MIGDYKTADDAAVGQFVKGFATIDDVTLVNVEVGLTCLAITVSQNESCELGWEL